uniref:F-box protein CPR1-like n=1 Tax=Cicer arietinum TaxID=3827 RepID=A0A1S2XMR7_CICAR|nr:F-box protein CPR1-like [Cicer arietinum]
MNDLETKRSRLSVPVPRGSSENSLSRNLETQHHSVVLSNDLTAEILSLLPLESLMQLKCVCRSWKTIIFDPIFIKMHLHQFQQNKRINVNENILKFIGSHNGLLCLINDSHTAGHEQILLYIWNPATRSLSNEIVFCCEEAGFCPFYGRPRQRSSWYEYRRRWKFSFCYDNSNDTYKILAFRLMSNEVRLFSSRDNIWTNIQRLPVVPIDYGDLFHGHLRINGAVCVSGTINWLAIRNKPRCIYEDEWRFITIDRFEIISFDLSTETYRQLFLPNGFDKVPHAEPTLAVLMDSLCFSHDFDGTHFIIWQMKEFGVQDSWNQFLKISYQSLPIDSNVLIDLKQYGSRLALLPLCLNGNDDTLILAWSIDSQTLLYNLRDNRVEINITDISIEIEWLLAKDYIDSLVLNRPQYFNYLLV